MLSPAFFHVPPSLQAHRKRIEQTLNAELRERVPEIDRVEYHAARNELIGGCLPSKGRCRGGSVYRLEGEPVEIVSVAFTADKPKAKTALMND